MSRNYSFLPPSTEPFVKVNKYVKPAVDSSELARLLSLIFSPDKRTKLPYTDLTILCSDSVPADISAWARSHLFNEISDNSVSSIVQGSQIDDDTIINCTRNSGESDIDYINRVNSYVKSLNSEGHV